jgi:hypothetical protein
MLQDGRIQTSLTFINKKKLYNHLRCSGSVIICTDPASDPSIQNLKNSLFKQQAF